MAYQDPEERQAQVQERSRGLADIHPGGGRPVLWGPDPNRAGGRAERYAGLAHLAGRELGEPTSFAGGAGAPAPGTPGNVEVIRGGMRTYASPAAGGQEFATPLQAQQAYNRTRLQGSLSDIAKKPLDYGMVPPGPGREALEAEERGGLADAAKARYGEYRAPGQALEEIKATKEPPLRGEYHKAMAGKYDAETAALRAGLPNVVGGKNVAAYSKGLGLHFGTEDPAKKGTYKLPDDPDLHRIFQEGEEHAFSHGGEAGLDHVRNRVLEHYEGFATVPNIQAVAATLPPEKAKYMTPQALNWLKTNNPGEYYKFMREVGPELKKVRTGAGGLTGLVGGMAKAPGEVAAWGRNFLGIPPAAPLVEERPGM